MGIMTRPELHALVDIVMDARGTIKITDVTHRGNIEIDIKVIIYFNILNSSDYPTFSDFTKAVQEYIKTLEK